MSKKIIGITVGTPLNPQKFSGGSGGTGGELGYTPAKQTDLESIARNIPLYIKWDGNTEGRETVSPLANNTPFYKVSDLTYSADELNGSDVEINGFEGITSVADKSLFEETEDMIILKANVESAIITFGVVVKHDIDGSTKGIYFMDTTMGNTRVFTKKLSEIEGASQSITEEDIEAIEFITTEDIDNICSQQIEFASLSEVTF